MVARNALGSTRADFCRNQSSQCAQLLFCQRVSRAAKSANVSAHSAVNSGVRTDWNVLRASSTRTCRPEPPAQPMPAATTDVSSAATIKTVSPLGASRGLDYHLHGLGANGPRTLFRQFRKLPAQTFLLGLLRLADQVLDDVAG